MSAALSKRLRQHAADMAGELLIIDQAEAAKIRNDMLKAAYLLDTPKAPTGAKSTGDFTPWLMQIEQLSGRAYAAKDIAWFRENCFAKGMSPAKALDVREKGFGI